MSEPPVLTGSVVSGSRKYSGVDMTELSKAVEEWSASLPEDLSEFRTDHSVLERFLVARQLDKEQAAEMLRAHKAGERPRCRSSSPRRSRRRSARASTS